MDVKSPQNTSLEGSNVTASELVEQSTVKKDSSNAENSENKSSEPEQPWEIWVREAIALRSKPRVLILSPTVKPGCNNPHCPSTGDITLHNCPTCDLVPYCSDHCENADQKKHHMFCQLQQNSPPDLKGYAMKKETRIWPQKEEEEDDDDDDDRWLKELKFKIIAPEGQEIGKIEINIVNRRKIRSGFFGELDSMSRDLASLATLFDTRGRFLSKIASAGKACWTQTEIDGGRLVHLIEMEINREHRCKGIGSWAIPRLFLFPELKKQSFMFVWPGVLTHELPPPVNGPFAPMTPSELRFRDEVELRIIKFYRRVGFRRVGNTALFCFAKNPAHPSRAIPADQDAAYVLTPESRLDNLEERAEAEMYGRAVY
ncbi:hypothetical protein SISNIDRAFT_482877 [Sistotremastrum niveocremeum HHB9708]|uniref:MYND-type domain-containing protein n=1 Tax=Sistotremastrum niveocremeum HHB9708 TaxID=1314777 RepID=A0A164XU28_9AGAM|nr:hypothetical protein SISNIDRAFT_482877 [Sistotremastrum niveocremeum HHB9708]